MIATQIKPSLQDDYCLFDTAIGPCGVAWSARELTRLQLPEADRAAAEKRLRAASGSPAPTVPPPSIREAIAAIQRYLAGERVDFSFVAIDLTRTDPFQRKVYEAARSLGWGQTTTYGALARLAGFPDGARAVGQALGRNPVPLIVPCHRILASGGRIGGFSAPGGAFTKERLLALEGVLVGVDPDAPRLPGL